MSDTQLRGPSRPGRRAAALGAVLVGLLLILGAGTLLGQDGGTSATGRIPLVGRTTTICTTSAPPSGEPAGKTQVSAVSIREAPNREGLLTASTLKSKPSELKLTEPGKGAQLSGVTSPVMITADGVMASTSSAVIVGDVMEGPEVGIKAAPCLAPATSHWFSGLGATDADRTDLILTNPDDAQAQVDLRFYGRNGRIVVPGSPGVLIKAHESRTVSLRVWWRPTARHCGCAGKPGSCQRSGEADADESAEARRSRLADPIGGAELRCGDPWCA